MQLKYRNTLYVPSTQPTLTPSEVLQGTYRGLSVAINVTHNPTLRSTEHNATEHLVQYRGVKTHLSFA